MEHMGDATVATLFGIDATNQLGEQLLRGIPFIEQNGAQRAATQLDFTFDLVIWNFPYLMDLPFAAKPQKKTQPSVMAQKTIAAALRKVEKKRNATNFEMRDKLRLFARRAQSVLVPGGELWISLADATQQYEQWDVNAVVSDAGFQQKGHEPFVPNDWPLYTTVYGHISLEEKLSGKGIVVPIDNATRGTIYMWSRLHSGDDERSMNSDPPPSPPSDLLFIATETPSANLFDARPIMVLMSAFLFFPTMHRLRKLSSLNQNEAYVSIN